MDEFMVGMTIFFGMATLASLAFAWLQWRRQRAAEQAAEAARAEARRWEAASAIADLLIEGYRLAAFIRGQNEEAALAILQRLIGEVARCREQYGDMLPAEPYEWRDIFNRVSEVEETLLPSGGWVQAANSVEQVLTRLQVMRGRLHRRALEGGS